MLDEPSVKRVLTALDWDELEVDTEYSLGTAEESVLEEFLPLNANVRGDEFWIRRSTWTDFLSYKIHTNRELHLMLNGVKPLSVFVDFHPGDSCDIPEELFDPLVKKGKFHTQQFIVESENDEKTVLRYVHYSMPDENWRMDAYMKLIGEIRKKGASPDLERQEGSLLGYTDSENEEFLIAKARYTKSFIEFITNYNSLNTVFRRKENDG